MAFSRVQAARHVAEPTSVHMGAAKIVIRYLSARAEVGVVVATGARDDG